MSGLGSGRHREEAAWRAFEDALRARHDARRPLGRYRVVDNTPWSATGASFVWLRVNGARRLAIYRDGPQPAVGSFLQAVRMSSDPTAPLLALPLPSRPATGGVAALLWVLDPASAFPHQRALHAVALWDEATNTWAYRGTPDGVIDTDAAVTGFNPGFYRRSIRYCGDRLFFWLTPALSWAEYFAATFASRPNAAYSDDDGATWTAFTVAGLHVYDLRPGHAAGVVYATCAKRVALGGSRGIYQSADNGATWASVYGPPAGTQADLGEPIAKWISIAPDPDTAGVVAVTSQAGVFVTTDDFATLSTHMGPEQQGASDGTNAATPAYPGLARVGGRTVYSPSAQGPTGSAYTPPDTAYLALRQQADPFPGGGDGAWMPLVSPQKDVRSGDFDAYGHSYPGGVAVFNADVRVFGGPNIPAYATRDGGATWFDLPGLLTDPAYGTDDSTIRGDAIVALPSGGYLAVMDYWLGATSNADGSDAWQHIYLAPGATTWVVAGTTPVQAVIGLPAAWAYYDGSTNQDSLAVKGGMW